MPRALVLALVLVLAPPAWALDYEACRQSLGKNRVDSGLLKHMTEGLLEQTKLPQRQWNYNGPYDPAAINLLFPSSRAASTWNSDACRGPAELPRCWSSKDQHIIICNPGFARWLEGSNFFGPPIALEVALAGRFMMQSVIGHELGHLELGGQGLAGHMRPDLNALTCNPEAPPGQSEEIFCDSRGAELACTTARGGDELQRILLANGGSLTWEKVYPLILSIRRELRAYEPTDDTCTGIGGYQSFVMRRRKLALQLVECIIKADSNPFTEPLRAELQEYERLEEELRAHQLGAIWTDPELVFSEEPTVHALDSRTFIVSGVEKGTGKGRLLLIHADGPRDASHRRVGEVPGRVRMLRRKTPSSWALGFESSEPGGRGSRLSEVELVCPKGLAHWKTCTVKAPTFGGRVPMDAVVAWGADGAVLVAQAGVSRVFKRPGDKKPSYQQKPAFSQSEVKLAAIRDRELAVSMQFERGGLFILEATTPGAQRFKSINLAGDCTVQELVLTGDQVHLLAFCDTQENGGFMLHDCPVRELSSPGQDLLLERCTKVEIPVLANTANLLFGEAFANPTMSAIPGCAGARIISQGDWSWVAPADRPAFILPAEQVVACDWEREQIIGVRGGKLNWLTTPALPEPPDEPVAPPP